MIEVTIYNMTQHKATPDQVAAGVKEQPWEGIVDLLTFKEMPTLKDIQWRAYQLADLAAGSGLKKVMIGGAPYLMGPLEAALKAKGLIPLYSFSKRECVETHLPDGTVKKDYVFKHEGFLEV